MTRTDDAGFSLIEALMATAITLVVLALTSRAFISGLNANNAIELLTGTNQNLQVASGYITQDLIKAGQGIQIGGLSRPNGPGATAIVRPIGTASTFPTSTVLSAVTAGDALGPLVMDTTTSTTRSDVITVIYMDQTATVLPLTSVSLTSTAATVVVTPTINTTTANTVRQGDLFVFTNPNGMTVMEVTGSTPNSQTLVFDNTDVLKFNQPGLPAGQGGIKQLVPTPTGYPPVSMQRLTMVTYYIDRTVPTQPVLMRRLGGTAPIPIAMGVENLQMQYYTFPSGASSLSLTSSPTNPDDVRKIDVYLGARSEDKAKQTNDYVRNSMATQVTVRSLGLFDTYR